MARYKVKAKSNKKQKKEGEEEEEGQGGLEPGEYFVEKIIRAKVGVISRGTVHWSYLVKWEGYDDPSEDTWEPVRSFKDSEQFVDEFWGDADMKGRDKDDPQDWVRGDIVNRLQIGKPARRASTRRKPQREASPEVEESEVASSQQGEESEVDRILETEQETEPSPSPPPPKRGRAPRHTVLSLTRKSARGKPAASKPKSPRRKSTSAVSPKKRKAVEELDESAAENDEETSKEPVAAPPVKIGPPRKKKRQLKKKPTGPDNSSTNDPPHQDPETQLPESGTVNTPKGSSTPAIAESPVRRQVQTGQFSSISREARSPSDIPNPPDHSDKATSATPPPRPVGVPKTPQHRHRAANPRVRMMDINEIPDAPGEKVDHMENAISAKAKFAGGEPKPPSEASSSKRQPAKRRKPGPGRSSHGFVGSQEDTLVNDENPPPPVTDVDEDMEEGDENQSPSRSGEITKEELMDMVGLKEDEANNLPDFNDEPMDVETEVVQTTVTEITVESVRKTPVNDRPISKPSLFGKPSIFGPLSMYERLVSFLGLRDGSPSDRGAGSSRSLDRNAFALKLDTSVDVSVVLQDMKPGTGSGPVATLDLKEIFSKTPSSAPGKFYNHEAGIELLVTLKSGGPCARVELMPVEDEEHEKNWEKFRDRLENKDTFVTGAGLHTLVLVASSNTEACETLGVADILTGIRREIIVVATDIEDVSRYSDAVDLADSSRWL